MRITLHARVQMTRRRLRREDVDMAIGYGTETHCAGATFFVLRLTDIPPAMRADADARRAEGTTVVVEGDTIVTAYRNRDPRAMRRKRAA